MDIKANAPRKGRHSLFGQCAKVTLEARDAGEAAFLAALVRAMSGLGGKIVVTPKGRDPVEIEFGETT